LWPDKKVCKIKSPVNFLEALVNRVNLNQAMWSEAKKFCCSRGMNLLTVQNRNKQTCLYKIGENIVCNLILVEFMPKFTN